MMIPPAAEEVRGAEVSLAYTGTMDAITRGTADGLRLAVNVGRHADRAD